MWADKSKGSKVEKVEKSRGFHGAGTPRAAVGFVLHSRALALLWWRGSPAVMLFHVKPRTRHDKSFITTVSYGLTPVP